MFEFKSPEKIELERLQESERKLLAENKKLKQTSTLLNQLNPILEKAATNDTYYQALTQYVAEVTKQLGNTNEIDVFLIKEYLETLIKGSSVEIFVGMELYNRLYQGYHEEGTMKITNALEEGEGILDLYNLRTNREFDLDSLLAQVYNKEGLVILSDVKTKSAKLSQYSSVAVYRMEELLGISPGFIVFLDKRRFTYSPNEKEMIEIFITLIQPVINSKIISEQLTREAETAMKSAYTDQLTKMNNRGKFTKDYLNNDENESDVIMFFDLCKLKQINDNYGHDIADTVLIEFGRQVNEFVNQLGGTGYRLGGDEFVARVPVTTSNEDITREAEIFIEKYRATPFMNHLGEIFYSDTSLGIFRNEYPYIHQEDALKKSDSLMYKSKHETGNIEYSWKQ